LAAFLLAAAAGPGRAAAAGFPKLHGIFSPGGVNAGLAGAGTLPGAEPWIITSRVTVTRPMESGDIIVAAGGELIVRNVPEPGFSIAGNLWVVQSGRAELRDSVIQFLSTYHGQYSLAATDDATVLVDGCDYRIPHHVHHGLIVVGNASLTLRDTSFDDVQLLAFEHGRLAARRLDGHFEVILQDAGDITLEDIPRESGEGSLWVWPTFPDGSEAVYSPPLPGLVEEWTFPPPGAAGIQQRCRIVRCQVLLWPMLVEAGSQLTLQDIGRENWVVVGLHLPNQTVIEGLTGGGPPLTGTIGLPDRTLTLDRASIDTWNLYPQDRAHVAVRDSTVGEIIAVGEASVLLERSIVDGSGGYLGAYESAHLIASDSKLTCDVEATGEALVELHRCQALPYPQDPTGVITRFGAYDRARLLADTTIVTSRPALGGSGVIGVTWIADPPATPPGWGPGVELSGVAAVHSLDPRAALSRWELLAIPAGSTTATILGEGHENIDPAGPLGTWRDADPYRSWELRLVLRDGFGRILSGGLEVPARPLSSPGARRPIGRRLPHGP